MNSAFFRARGRRAGLAAGVALLTTLSGCAVLGGGTTPLDTYELTAPQAGTDGPRRARLQVLVSEPVALKSLDGQNIVIKPDRGVIQYLKDAQWADRLPRVVQARLAEAFQASGQLGGVGQPGQGLAIDYQIVGEIRSFEIRVDGAPRAHVELFMKVLNDRTGVVRAARSFEAQVAVSGTGNDAFIAALDRAFRQVASDVVSWSLSVM